jgi:antitoxin PrlF
MNHGLRVMPEARLSTKGQVVIPKPIRDHLHLKPGDRFDFSLLENGDVLLRPLSARLTDLRGLLADHVTRRLSLEDMERVVEEHAARRARKW